MYARTTSLLLRWLRVPPEPHAPHGDPASLRVFRAGPNFFKLRLARWTLAQVLALAGIVFWLAVFLDVEAGMRERRASGRGTTTIHNPRELQDYLEQASAAEAPPQVAPAETPAATTPHGAPRHRVRVQGWAGLKRVFVEAALLLPPWAFPLLWTLKIAGIVAYLVQLPVTYLIARLDYEMRWYMVTDRSLRIRHGVWKVSESTMSFANIQQVEVSQGPLQRALGIADVRVQSAGGGSATQQQKAHGEDMHLGLFHSVTNAPEIRDLILARLRRFRESGLGDPEDKPVAPAVEIAATHDGTLAAARELLAEAKALRQALR